MKYSFFKTESYQRFEYIPRYYDPVKEDIERRKRLIAADMKLEKEGKVLDDLVFEGYSRRIKESYKKKNKMMAQTVLLRLGIVAVLVIAILYVL